MDKNTSLANCTKITDTSNGWNGLTRASSLELKLLPFHLGGQKAKTLLGCDALLGELVIRRESRGVGALRRGAVAVLLLQGVHTLAIGIEEIHEMHGQR